MEQPAQVAALNGGGHHLIPVPAEDWPKRYVARQHVAVGTDAKKWPIRSDCMFELSFGHFLPPECGWLTLSSLRFEAGIIKCDKDFLRLTSCLSVLHFFGFKGLRAGFKSLGKFEDLPGDALSFISIDASLGSKVGPLGRRC